MESVGLRATGTVGFLDEAQKRVEEALRGLAQAKAQAALASMSDDDLARRVVASENQIAYAKRQLAVARAEQLRRRGN
jgi:hypothetical protein